MESIRIQADMIAVTPEQVISPGQIVVRNGRVTEVAAVCNISADIVFADTALLPGLVNCHTHLEFSDLGEPFPSGANFPEWISAVVRHRIQQSEGRNEVETQLLRRQALLKGLVESSRSGVVALADIVSQPWTPADLPTPDELQGQAVELLKQISLGRSSAESVYAELEFARPLSPTDLQQHLRTSATPQLVAFPELIGLTTERLQATCEWAWELHQLANEAQAAAWPSTNAILRSIELSPHAPYSLSLKPVETLLARLPTRPKLAMHVAESREELQWIETGQGAFADAFLRLGLPAPRSRVTIESAIELLSAASHGLLIHGNYLTDTQIEDLAMKPNLSVVYCPRTHTHFNHEPYPLDQLLSAGVRVVLGTDSRASSPNLSLIEEMQEMLRKHPRLAPATAWAAATSQAAQALGLDADFGTLQVGRLASFLGFRTDQATTPGNLFEQAIHRPQALTQVR